MRQRHRVPARSPDTTREASEAQLALYRRLGGPARAAIAFRLTAQVREIAIAGIRHRHPEYDDTEVLHAWRRLVLGDEATRQIFPNRPLVEP